MKLTDSLDPLHRVLHQELANSSSVFLINVLIRSSVILLPGSDRLTIAKLLDSDRFQQGVLTIVYQASKFPSLVTGAVWRERVNTKYRV